jgi:hypothetical protein
MKKKSAKPKVYSPELRGQSPGITLTPQHLSDLWYAHEEAHDPDSPLRAMLVVLRGADIHPDDEKLLAWRFEKWAGEWVERRMAFFGARADEYEQCKDEPSDALLKSGVRQAGWVDDTLLKLTVYMVRGRFGFTDPRKPKPVGRADVAVLGYSADQTIHPAAREPQE